MTKAQLKILIKNKYHEAQNRHSQKLILEVELMSDSQVQTLLDWLRFQDRIEDKQRQKCGGCYKQKK